MGTAYRLNYYKDRLTLSMRKNILPLMQPFLSF